jgi:enoyl-CoA hydratase
VEGAFQIGLNEVKIGMTLHHVGIALARDRLSPAVFQRSVNNAEMFNPQGALQAGFLDQVVPVEALMSTAHAVALQLKQLNMAAHKATKRKVRKALLDTLDAAIETDKVTGLN